MHNLKRSELVSFITVILYSKFVWFDQGPTLKVTTILYTPFVMFKAGQQNNSDLNESLEGYAIDLLKSVSDLVGFRYKLYIVPDNYYGTQDTSGQWKGMIGQLINRVIKDE